MRLDNPAQIARLHAVMEVELGPRVMSDLWIEQTYPDKAILIRGNGAVSSGWVGKHVYIPSHEPQSGIYLVESYSNDGRLHTKEILTKEEKQELVAKKELKTIRDDLYWVMTTDIVEVLE